MPEHDCLPPDVSASDFVVHMGRMSGLPATVARERAADILRHVGLDEERYRQMGGYSTGMKQRAKLAQALVHDPRLVFLDEPTNGLDPAGPDRHAPPRAAHRPRLRHRRARHLAPARRAGEGQRPRDRARRRPAAAVVGDRRLHPADRRAAGRGARGDAERDRLGESLAKAGLTCRPRGALIAIDPPPPDVAVHDLVRDTAADLALALVRIQPDQAHLEDVFLAEGAAHV